MILAPLTGLGYITYKHGLHDCCDTWNYVHSRVLFGIYYTRSDTVLFTTLLRFPLGLLIAGTLRNVSCDSHKHSMLEYTCVVPVVISD